MWPTAVCTPLPLPVVSDLQPMTSPPSLPSIPLVEPKVRCVVLMSPRYLLPRCRRVTTRVSSPRILASPLPSPLVLSPPLLSSPPRALLAAAERLMLPYRVYPVRVLARVRPQSWSVSVADRWVPLVSALQAPDLAWPPPNVRLALPHLPLPALREACTGVRIDRKLLLP